MRRPFLSRRLAARRGAAFLGVGALALTALLPVASASADGASYDTGGAVRNILPPGSHGNVNTVEAAQVGPSRTGTSTTPHNFADQLEMYDALGKVSPGQLGESDLASYYKDAAIDLPAGQEVSSEAPRPGTTIRRDRFGVPFVVGVTAEDVAFGAGFAGTEDRMFLTDLLRHVGSSRTVEFLGPGAGNVAMDIGQLRVAPYTQAEAQAQISSVLQRYPKEGPLLLRRLDAFIAGINAAQNKLCPAAFGLPVGGVTGGSTQTGAGFGPDCPVEYAALEKPPTDFTRADIVSIASLVGGIFGRGGGGEAANARWLTQLQAKYGDARGLALFEDLRERNDPEAPSTASVRFPYEGNKIDRTVPGAAVPDLTGPTASGTGADAGSTNLTIPPPASPTAPVAADYGVVSTPWGRLDLGLRPHGMSNALLVDAKHSVSGHPTVVFGPQTGYVTPQLLTEVSLRGPGIAARGVSFAGTQLIVELGHGIDYAWSATSASSDNVDTVAERLCNTDGSAPTVSSTSYLVGSTCTPIDSYVHTETGVPSATGLQGPSIVKLQVLRTRHGIVTSRLTVGGKPVALVTQRSTYTHELDSAVGFARVNDPDFVSSAATFQQAFDAVDYTFNWFYVDDRDISYFGSGLIPIRPATVSADLPRWGDPAYDWQGYVGFAGHARQTNPPSGYLVSWNNKQAPGFSAADNEWGYGPVYRSQLLEERIVARLSGGKKISRPLLVEAMADAATVDLRGEVLLPLMLRVLGNDSSPEVALLRQWVTDGAHRVDRPRVGAYGDQAAIALFDRWWEDGNQSVARDVLRPALGDLVDALPQGIDDHPRQGRGSSWNGVAWYGYLSKDLRRVLGEKVVAPYSTSYCGAPAACRAVLRASLTGAVQRALAAQGVASVGALTYDKHLDDIRATTAGLVGTRPIDWQNRPTFQQVVTFTAHRPRLASGPAVSRPAVSGPAVSGGTSLAACR